MLRRVAVQRTSVSEECIDSIIRVTRMGEVGTTLALFLRSVIQLLVIANVIPSLPILVSDDGGDTLLRNVGFYKSHMA
jgi:hypothetical protein